MGLLMLKFIKYIWFHAGTVYPWFLILILIIIYLFNFPLERGGWLTLASSLQDMSCFTSQIGHIILWIN